MNKKEIYIHTICLILIIALFGCRGVKMEEEKTHYRSLKDVPAASWEKLSKKKIYFGHQSVGYNIIDGIRAILKNNPQINLNIIETSKRDDLQNGSFAHSPIGVNMNPQSKIDDFSKIIENGIGGVAEIAFFKLCYVDIQPGTNLEQVFARYKETMARLAARYPQTKFVHITVPLNTNTEGVKGMLKKVRSMIRGIMGKEDADGNLLKNEYNEKMRSEYEKTGLLFDLALSESTFPDGRGKLVKSGESTIQTLVPDYTDDGGHLNAKGQVKIAEDFLLFLVNL